MANSKKGTKQQAAITPKQKVAKAFGSKAALVDKIIALIGDAPEGSRSALNQVSNSRLISHHRATARMVELFGSRDGAITAVLAVRFPKGAPEGERARLEGLSPWRLMDTHRQAVDGQKAAAVAAVKAEKAAKLRAVRRAKQLAGRKA
ncbi:MAG: hypothetical protein ACOYOB_01155 [Myxococcota bacterium]